jgi:hypothetical protein
MKQYNTNQKKSKFQMNDYFTLNECLDIFDKFKFLHLLEHNENKTLFEEVSGKMMFYKIITNNENCPEDCKLDLFQVGEELYISKTSLVRLFSGLRCVNRNTNKYSNTFVLSFKECHVTFTNDGKSVAVLTHS